MNTPTLISILSSPTGSAEPAKLRQSVDSAHGLDFSRLLGEKRSPIAASQRPSQNNVSRTAHTPQRSNQAPERPEARNQTGHAGNSASSNATATVRHENTSASPQQPTSGSAQAGAPEAADTPVSGSNSGGHASLQVADQPNATQESGQLAQAAAEAGLSGAHALQAMQNPAVAPLLQGSSEHSAAQAQMPGLATPEKVAPAPGSIPLAGFEAETNILPDTTDALPRVAAGTQPAATALPATPVQAAVAQIFNGASAAPSKAAIATTPSAANLVAAHVQPPATDTVNAGAAALSLQEFTAMVAAARDTSGTALPIVASTTVPGAAPLSPASVPVGLMMPVGMQPGQAPTVTMPGAGIRAPLGSPQWPAELGRQFISIAQAPNNLGKIAELRLDPPELGPLRITINLNDNVAHAVFSSPHALVRQTVENALPQLQHMLEQAGISLGQANVNDQHASGQASQDQTPAGHQHAQASGSAEAAGGIAGTGDTPARPSNPNALVDTFV